MTTTPTMFSAAPERHQRRCRGDERDVEASPQPEESRALPAIDAPAAGDRVELTLGCEVEVPSGMLREPLCHIMSLGLLQHAA